MINCPRPFERRGQFIYGKPDQEQAITAGSKDQAGTIRTYQIIFRAKEGI
jgi:hypothetical protein